MRKWLKRILGVDALENRVLDLELKLGSGAAEINRDIAREWKKERSQYAPGTPKWVAFTRRLRSLGLD